MDILSDKLVNITVNSKIELLGVVQYLADDPTIIKENSQYINDIRDHFQSYKNDPVVHFYKELRRKGFAYHLPPKFMLFTDENLELKNDIHMEGDLLRVLGSMETMNVFLSKLKEFKQKSSFEKFCESQRSFYNSTLSFVTDEVSKSKCIQHLIAYYGYSQHSFTIVIHPCSIGGYAARIPFEGNTFDAYNFMVVPDSIIEFIELVLHEFGHSYVNPLTRENINLIYEYEYLFEPIKDSMRKQAYSTWENCVNEHIVRAITSRILFAMYGNEIAQSRIGMDIQRDFIYTGILYDKLTQYELERSRFPVLNDFYLYLLRSLKDIDVTI